MTKSELITRVAKLHPDRYHRDLEQVVDAVFSQIASALARGDRVELRGFGAFHLSRREARTGRNPKTGAPVQVAEKHFPLFRIGKQLRERLKQLSDAVA